MEKSCIVDKAEFVASSGPILKAQPMNEIQTIDVEAVEAHMLTLPQIEIPVEHIFGPGIYIRQGLLPAGYIVMGHHHKIPCLNMLLTGKMALLEGGSRREITAPYIFTTTEGRKTAYMLEDCVFQNIYATEETDLDKIEEMCVEKSEAYKEMCEDKSTTYKEIT